MLVKRHALAFLYIHVVRFGAEPLEDREKAIEILVQVETRGDEGTCPFWYGSARQMIKP